MIRLADLTLPAQQALVCGRVYDSLSGRGHDDFDGVLTFDHQPSGGRRGPALPVRLGHRPDGWFVFSAPDVRQVPAPPADDPVRLIVHLALPGRDPLQHTVEIPRDEFTVVETEVKIDGRTIRVPSMPRAPWQSMIPVAPRPVALDGIVLHDHDPTDPAAGVTVSVTGIASQVTDLQGRFFLPALPVSPEVTLTLAAPGDPPREERFRPDYDRPVNRVALSLPA